MLGNSAFLNHFEPRFRGVVGDVFYRAVRECASDGEVPRHIRTQLETRNLIIVAELDTALAMYPSEAVEMVKYARWHDGLNAQERASMRKERSEEGRRQYMQSQPPTEKQLTYLRRLGFRGEMGEIDTRWKASEAIESLLEKKDLRDEARRARSG